MRVKIDAKAGSMRKKCYSVAILLVTLVTVEPASAEGFQIDLAPDVIRKAGGITALEDLAVGDTGRIRMGTGVCGNSDNTLMLNPATPIREPSEYISFWLVKRLPNGQVELESKYPDSTEGDPAELRKSKATTALSLSKLRDCETIKEPEYDVDDWLAVVRIDGASSLTTFAKKQISGVNDAAELDPEPSIDNEETNGKESVDVKGEWMVSTDRSPVDDTERVTLMLPAENVEGGGMLGNEATIIARCRSNNTSLYVVFGSVLDEEDGKVELVVRHGEREATTVRWSRSTSYTAAGLWNGNDAIPFIRKMANHNRLVVQASYHSGGRVTGVFDTEGLSDAIEPLTDACHWTLES